MRKYICIVSSEETNNISLEICDNLVYIQNKLGRIIDYEFKDDISKILEHKNVVDKETFFIFRSIGESDFIDIMEAIDFLSEDEYLGPDCYVGNINNYCSFKIDDILVIYHEQ